MTIGAGVWNYTDRQQMRPRFFPLRLNDMPVYRLDADV
jgi:hypothetical protein